MRLMHNDRAGQLLPTNFDLIPINAQQIQRLKDEGIEYSPETGRRVDDLLNDF